MPIFGLPDRIRTYGLQSRSLTRYPAVPRVEILDCILYRNCLTAMTFRVCCSGRIRQNRSAENRVKLRCPRDARFPAGMRSLTRYPAVPSVRVSLSSSFASLRNRQLALSGLRSIKTILNRFYLRSPRVESIKLRYNRFALWAITFRVCCSGLYV